MRWGLEVYISYYHQCGKGKTKEHHVLFGSYIAIIFFNLDFIFCFTLSWQGWGLWSQVLHAWWGTVSDICNAVCYLNFTCNAKPPYFIQLTGLLSLLLSGGSNDQCFNYESSSSKVCLSLCSSLECYFTWFRVMLRSPSHRCILRVCSNMYLLDGLINLYHCIWTGRVFQQ